MWADFMQRSPQCLGGSLPASDGAPSRACRDRAARLWVSMPEIVLAVRPLLRLLSVPLWRVSDNSLSLPIRDSGEDVRAGRPAWRSEGHRRRPAGGPEAQGECPAQVVTLSVAEVGGYCRMRRLAEVKAK